MLFWFEKYLTNNTNRVKEEVVSRVITEHSSVSTTLIIIIFLLNIRNLLYKDLGYYVIMKEINTNKNRGEHDKSEESK